MHKPWLIVYKVDYSVLGTLLSYFIYYDSCNLKVGQEKESCVKVNTRELNIELCTGLSILYT